MTQTPGRVSPRTHEVTWGTNDLIVSKTDLKGHITYANDVFVTVSGYSEAELIGRPHNVIRHPDMPGGVFRLLWQTVQAGQELFAYVKNLHRDGGYYWVLAHVTPNVDTHGRIVGYHSSRRCPDRAAIQEIEPVYTSMRAAEQAARKAEAAAEGLRALETLLAGRGVIYEEFIWDVITRHDASQTLGGRSS